MGIFDWLFGKKKEKYIQKITFKNGIRTIKYYYENNQLYQEGIQKDRKKHGLWKQYYKNGQLRGEFNYKEGTQHGIQNTYYENGQLKLEGNKLNGIFDGVLKMYYENGQLETEANMKDGELISKKCWSEDGNETECK